MTLLSFLLTSFLAQANCVVLTSKGSPSPAWNDSLQRAMGKAAKCPQSPDELRGLLQNQKIQTRASMVANRGRQNPNLGSFSFFERGVGPAVPEGALFFGHFTAAQGGVLSLDQENQNGKLLIELIAWDDSKGFYNFYEMIGDPSGPQWFYRGDSADILSDNQMISRTNPNLPPQIGNRMRCSGCHASGGPIMKELAPPHNDWWTKSRPLILGANQPNAGMMPLLQNLADAHEFSFAVTSGIQRLEASPSYQNLKRSRSLAEQLRPVFCENEINLSSDFQGSPAQGPILIPGAFFGPFVTIQAPTFAMPASFYQNFISQFALHFPETPFPDADHAWLAPIRSFADNLAVQSLLRQGILDEKSLLDIFSVDLEHPLFSKDRCALLNLLPNASGSQPVAVWKTPFLQNLKRSGNKAALFLAQEMENPALDVKAHLSQLKLLSLQWNQSLGTPKGAEKAFRLLLETREAVKNSPISKNPRGQILEPGFRVIFPISGSVSRF